MLDAVPALGKGKGTSYTPPVGGEAIPDLTHPPTPPALKIPAQLPSAQSRQNSLTMCTFYSIGPLRSLTQKRLRHLGWVDCGEQELINCADRVCLVLNGRCDSPGPLQKLRTPPLSQPCPLCLFTVQDLISCPSLDYLNKLEELYLCYRLMTRVNSSVSSPTATFSSRFRPLNIRMAR